MPFTKITKGKNKGKYKSPSGKVWSFKQMRSYYAKKKKKWVIHIQSLKKRKVLLRKVRSQKLNLRKNEKSFIF